MGKCVLFIAFIILCKPAYSQELDVFTFSEYLAYVKKHHPIVKQAHLVISESEAKLLKARGAFDPKLEVDYNRKKFKDTEYYDKLNTTFKIPTWYGIELKGNFENNSGVYLNPENKVPDDGLYSMGVSVSLAKGLLINKRMATLKQAKMYLLQAEEENKLLVNEILYLASLTYFKWLKTHREKQVYEAFLKNAELRFKGVKRSHELGEKPAIDTTEARIAFSNRKLNLEKANLNYIKSSLALSNFLWINNVPVEMQATIFPDVELANYIDESLQLKAFYFNADLTNHPKLQSLDYKTQGLEVEKQLKRNNLLPKIDLQYNFLSKTPETLNTFNSANYKASIAINLPLFLRKERADLKLANYKLKAINFEKQATKLSLKNKLNSVNQEIISYENQITIINTIVSDYVILLKGEERKFEIGESSLFLINSRESKLIENQLKEIKLENSLFETKGKLFNVLTLN